MSLLRRNIIANLSGGIFIGGLTLVITPLQVNLLGFEAYGLIGFIAMIQVIVRALDMGLSSTITLELAGDITESKDSSKALLRTAISFYWSFAFLLGIALYLAAPRIGALWFSSKILTNAEITLSLQLVAIILALRWPIAVYAGALSGAQRMDILNVIKVMTTSFLLLGGILVLIIWRDLKIFLLWNAVSAFFEVVTYMIVCRLKISDLDWRPGYSWNSIKAVWSFSLAMNGLALLSMVITQMDRLVISKLLPLQDLGYYSLAYNVATSISLILSSFGSALIPSIASAYAAKEWTIIRERYYTSCRLTIFLTGMVLFSLIFFGKPLLAIWVSDEASVNAWSALMFISIGLWFSAACSNAYSLSIAARQPRKILILSASSLALYVPFLYTLMLLYGIDGVAFAFMVLNAVYLMIIVPNVQKDILHLPIKPWFLDMLIPFSLTGFIVFGGFKLSAVLFNLNNIFELLLLVFASCIYIAVGCLFLKDILYQLPFFKSRFR